MKIVIFGSEYGTAKRYAEELARKIQAECVSYKDVESLDHYQTIIFFGALYAGGVLGLKKTAQKYDLQNKRLIVATVGLADPTDETNTENIKQSIKRQLPPDIFTAAEILHLRGGIDYSQLNFKHKTMMRLLYQKAKELPEEKKSPEVRAMIETYNKQVDFVDFASLEQIVDRL